MLEDEQSSWRCGARPIIVELFIKDELQYEVQLRGGVPRRDVAALRSQLRDLLVEDPPRQKVQIDDVDLEFSNCNDQWAELLSLMEEGESLSKSPRAFRRVLQRLQHLAGRLNNLLKQDSVTESVEQDTRSLLSKVIKAKDGLMPCKQSEGVLININDESVP